MQEVSEPVWPAIPKDEDLLVSVVIPGEPVAKQRPRTSPAEYVVGPNGQRIKTRKAHTYTPKKTEQGELLIGWSLREARVRRNEFDDLTVRVVFYSKDTSRYRDVDNLIKTLLDACNSIAWADDSQVTRIVADLERDESNPRTELAVYVRLRRGMKQPTTRKTLQSPDRDSQQEKDRKCPKVKPQ